VPSRPGVAATYLRWTGARAACHRGYWLVASLYLVFDARLSPFQLVFLGTAQGVASLVSEVPAGVMADTISRRWSLVVAHALVAASMVATGLVTAFPALVATQVLWGVGWTFASGADVAWVTDELDRPDRIAGVLAASARVEQVGALAGMVGVGALAGVTDRRTAMVVAGVAMGALGLYVAARFAERRFTPTRARRWRRSAAILRRGAGLARRDREILLVFTATFLVNGAAEAFGRLWPRRLVDLGVPADPDPIVWFTALGVVTLVVGALALRIVEARIDGPGAARRTYAAACGAGVVGLVVLARAPDDATGAAGVLLVGGVAMTVTRAVGTIWVNRRATGEVRATVHSFLAQTEYAGELSLGFCLGVVAQATTLTVALTAAGALIAGACVLVLVSPADRPVAAHAAMTTAP
jgi:MFS family permease